MHSTWWRTGMGYINALLSEPYPLECLLYLETEGILTFLTEKQILAIKNHWVLGKLWNLLGFCDRITLKWRGVWIQELTRANSIHNFALSYLASGGGPDGLHQDHWWSRNSPALQCFCRSGRCDATMFFRGKLWMVHNLEGIHWILVPYDLEWTHLREDIWMADSQLPVKVVKTCVKGDLFGELVQAASGALERWGFLHRKWTVTMSKIWHLKSLTWREAPPSARFWLRV